MSVEHLPEPPGPPQIRRRIRLYRFQWIGLVVLASLPALAISGFFGESWRSERVRGRHVEVLVTYPDRLRYKQLNSVEVWLRNVTATPLDTLRLSLDPLFGNRFSAVRGIPPFDHPYLLSVGGLEPGETKLVLIELQAEEYGRHSGTLMLTGPDSLRIPLSVRIFP